VCTEMIRSTGVSRVNNILGGASPVNLGCLLLNEPRSGNWYVGWAQCEVINLSTSSGHPRWQPTILTKRGTTPSNPTSSGLALKRRLSDSRWKQLKLLANSNGQVKIPSHHLAFKSNNPDVALPHNLGRGSSVSHMCDRAGCIKSGHLELTEHHIDNLERQRCHGVTLVVAADMIIHEVPCSHARGNSPAGKIETSCRKIRMVWLPDQSVDALIENYQQILVALRTPQSSQTQ
jgi:hypothetical protein